MRQTLKTTPEYGAAYGAENGAARGAPYPLAVKPGGYGAPPSAGCAVGRGNGAEYGAVVINVEYITWRLEEAGWSLLSLPNTGYSTRLRTSALDVVRDMADAYGWTEKRLRPPMPSAAAIDRMDDAYGWLALIPDGKYVIRRIVAARSLVHPLTERHLFPWRRLGDALGADHKAVQRWWGQGVDFIVSGLGRGNG